MARASLFLGRLVTEATVRLQDAVVVSEHVIGNRPRVGVCRSVSRLNLTTPDAIASSFCSGVEPLPPWKTKSSSASAPRVVSEQAEAQRLVAADVACRRPDRDASIFAKRCRRGGSLSCHIGSRQLRGAQAHRWGWRAVHESRLSRGGHASISVAWRWCLDRTGTTPSRDLTAPTAGTLE